MLGLGPEPTATHAPSREKVRASKTGALFKSPANSTPQDPPASDDGGIASSMSPGATSTTPQQTHTSTATHPPAPTPTTTTQPYPTARRRKDLKDNRTHFLVRRPQSRSLQFGVACLVNRIIGCNRRNCLMVTVRLFGTTPPNSRVIPKFPVCFFALFRGTNTN